MAVVIAQQQIAQAERADLERSVGAVEDLTDAQAKSILADASELSQRYRRTR